MGKIKVLWIMTGGLRRNGICVSQLDYAMRIDKNKFQLDVLAVHNNSDEMISDYEAAGCKVILLPDRKKQLFKYINQLKMLIKENNYDIVHTFGSSSLMGIELNIAKKNGIKVRIAHSRNTTCDRVFLERVFRPIFNGSYNYAFSCGKDAGEWLFGNKKYKVLHNGKDLNKYSFNKKTRDKIRKKYNLHGKKAIGHVGNFNNQKNHKFLIDVFYDINKEDNNTVLFLVGSGNLIDNIKEKVSQLKLDDKVYFLGSIDNVEEVIQGMDIMIFPSLFEGLPNVVIEWQASGLPCILSDKITKECAVSDMVEFISIENGTKEWVACYEKSIHSERDREKDSINNCNLLKKKGFDIIENTRIIEDIYISSVNERS